MRRLSPLLIVLALLAVPASASAVNVRVGIGDQSPEMFTDSNYQSLNLKLSRYFIEWNAISQPDEMLAADTFVLAAKAHGVKVLMHVSTDNINVGRPKLPSVAAYRKSVGALIRHFKPLGVTDWGAWNEANHKSQPTSNRTKGPANAAKFFGEMRGMCTGCTIVALDVLDQAGVQDYIARFYKAAGKNAARASIVGIHNYSEVNRKLGDKRSAASLRKYPGTKRIIDAVHKANKRAKFWYTETGGVTKLGSAFPCDDARAANRTQFMFNLAKKYDRVIDRLYTYNWSPTPVCSTARFDSGLVNPDGTPRPAFAVFKRNLASFKR
jgi:hypothetical protein